MDFLDNIFDYNTLQPEDINPELRGNYIKDVHDYYSEPPVSRYRNKVKKPVKSCPNCSNRNKDNQILNILIILLIVITVIQWVFILFSNNAPVSITNIIKTDDKSPIIPSILPNPVISA